MLEKKPTKPAVNVIKKKQRSPFTGFYYFVNFKQGEAIPEPCSLHTENINEIKGLAQLIKTATLDFSCFTVSIIEEKSDVHQLFGFSNTKGGASLESGDFLNEFINVTFEIAENSVDPDTIVNRFAIVTPSLNKDLIPFIEKEMSWMTMDKKSVEELRDYLELNVLMAQINV